MIRGLAVVVSLLVLGLGVALAACSSQPEPPHHAPATRAQLASVVVLVESVAKFQEPSLSSDDFGSHTGVLVSAWRGRCNAFALKRRGGPRDGEIYLVTALHCARQQALGATLRYLPPDGWGVDTAAIVKLDASRDYAELGVSRQGGLVPFGVGPAPSDGEPVLSVSAFFEEQAAGRSRGALSGPWYGTTQRIDHGWSGSPVLDARGRAWGYLARCETYKGKCASGAIAGVL